MGPGPEILGKLEQELGIEQHINHLDLQHQPQHCLLLQRVPGHETD